VPDWTHRVRSDPTALVGQPASALHEVLDEIDEAFNHRPWPLLVEIPSDRPVQVIGDSHGDWPAVSAALTYARRGRLPDRLVGLGDYIHRSTRSEPDPATLPSGSVWNAAFLLAWAAFDPDHVIPLRGNHESTRQLPVPGPTLLRELRRTFPRAEALPLWSRIIQLLERLPIAGRTENGVFLAHGGIPPAGSFDPSGWKASDLSLLEGLLWSDPDIEYEDRSVGFAYGRHDLDEFLRTVHCRMMIKGHAPGHSGRAIWGGKLLTIHTSDLFSRFGDGGVLLAEIPAQPRVENSSDIRLRRWDGTEWQPRKITSLPDGGSTDSPAPRTRGPIRSRAGRGRN
jgi:hypothetical protein